jgi:hypothetical protein
MNVAGYWLLVEQIFLVLTSNEQLATSNFVNLQFFCHKTNLSFWHRFEEEKCQYDNINPPQTPPRRGSRKSHRWGVWG